MGISTGTDGGRRVWALLAVVALALGAVACSGGDDEPSTSPTSTTGSAEPRYQATIRRTAGGVPHITADSWGSLGFGQGYAFAQAHLCTLADQVVKVRSERAKWFGAGEDDANLHSDLGYLALGIRDLAEQDLKSQPDDALAVITGYAAGYNAYLEETGVDALPDWCRGEDWVVPITPLDLFTYYRDLALFASGQNLLTYMATAAPPAAEPPADTGTTVPEAEGTAQMPEGPIVRGDLASNGWAVGADRSATGGGMVLANPHFPWLGERRLWESHLTIPDELDVYGASLLGAPGVQIGFNQHVAWTHTVSSGSRFTGYRLDLVPGSPTEYRYGDETRRMTSRTVEVEVKGDDGTVQSVEHELWSSHYGPMIDIPGLGWTDATAFTYRDANIDNDELISQFLGMNRAESMDEFQAVFREVGGIPWVNTMAADETGRAWYIDGAPTPALSDEAIAGWEADLESDPIVATAADSRLVLLDGSDPVNEWVELDGARDPGLVPFDEQPQTERSDYVFNANDSQWVPHETERLEGFSPLVGRERVEQSFRTRENIRMLAGDDLLTTDDLADRVLRNESYTAVLLREEVVERCTGTDPTTPAGEACAVLDEWDGVFDLDSRGAVLWRQFLLALPDDFLNGEGNGWAVPFDPEDPVDTPRGLAQPTCDDTGSCIDPVVAALAATAQAMNDADLALDVPLGEVQYTTKGEERIPVHGGRGIDGVLNVVVPGSGRQGTTLAPPLPATEEVPGLGGGGLGPDGYRIVDGTSFLMAVAFGDDGPEGKVLLTYSQSDDPASGNYDDQTRMFADKQWRPIRFTDDQIADDPEMEEFEVRS